MPFSLSRFFRDRIGMVGPVMAIAAVPLFGIVAIAVDHGRGNVGITDIDAIVQEACDRSNSAFFAHSPVGERLDAAQAVLAYRVANVAGLNDVTMSAMTVGSQVQVNASGVMDATLANVLGISTVDINISRSCGPETAAPPGEICLLTLDKDMKRALHFHDSLIEAKGCDIHVRSDADKAAVIHEQSRVTLNSLCVDGAFVTGALADEVIDNGLSGDIEGNVDNVCVASPDPLAGKPEYIPMACDYTNLEATKAMTVLNPGVYCGGIHIHTGSSVRMKPGQHVMAGGDLIMDPGSELLGDQITIILDNADSSMDMKSATLNLVAANSGPYTGIALFQHSSAPEITVDLEESSAITIDGTIYLPNAELNVSESTMTAATGGHLRVIANDFAAKYAIIVMHPNSDVTPTLSAF